jgi:hypothetical protein
MWQVLAAIAKRKIDQRMAEHEELKTEAMNTPPPGGEVKLNRQDHPIGAKSIIGAIAGGAAGASGGAAAESGASGGAAESGASGTATELGGGGGISQPAVASSAPAAAEKQIDVFGGQEYGKQASASAQKADPHIGEYIKNAMQNYARNKIGKKIGAALDGAADFANAFGEDNQTETGQKIQSAADWMYGEERKKRQRRQGLYAN